MALSHLEANTIRQEYNSGKKDVLQLAREYHVTTSNIRKIIANTSHIDIWYQPPARREFDMDLAVKLREETDYSLGKIARICSEDDKQPFTAEACRLKLKQYYETKQEA